MGAGCPNPSRRPRDFRAGRVGHLVVSRCPRICSRSTVSETCGLTLKTEGESAENRTEVPHPSVQTTDGRMDHPPLQYRAGDSCLRHLPKGLPPALSGVTCHNHSPCRRHGSSGALRRSRLTGQQPAHCGNTNTPMSNCLADPAGRTSAVGSGRAGRISTRGGIGG